MHSRSLIGVAGFQRSVAIKV